jgi:thiol-disulfide isomerase/thioredoxin
MLSLTGMSRLMLAAFGLLIISMQFSCVRPSGTFDELPPGIWRAVLMLDRQPVQKYGDDRDIVKKFDFDSELPFNFEVVYEHPDSNFHIIILNAGERIRVDDIRFGRDKATAKDTIVIRFPVYDSYISAIYEDGVMEGDWIVNYRENYKIPFKAVFGQAHRFTNVANENTLDVSGRWAVVFSEGTEDAYPAIADFEQKGNLVSGTFLTETGDFRYLDGQIIGSKLYMSVFDGSHAWLFISRINPDGTLSGVYRSGSHYTTDWLARRDPEFTLSNPYSLTRQVSKEPMNFSFPDSKGNMISLSDDNFRGKVKLIQIMGTWCPNCMDESRFMQDYFRENPDDRIELISLAFERYTDKEKAMDAIRRYESRMNTSHPVLLAGTSNKAEASAALPHLNKIMSFPTLLFLDSDNRIVKIHTGFNGPATKEFVHFKSEFEQILEELTKR